MLKAIRGTGLKTRLLHPVDTFWDLKLGVNTIGFVPEVGEAHAPQWRGAYVPTKYTRILQSLRHIGLNTSDVVVDLGCGLGRAVFAASWLGAQRAVGVEIDPGLAAQASHNARGCNLRGREIEFVCAGAETYSHAKTTVLFMFNPFGAGTMASVIRGLEQDMREQSRNLRIVYENPLQSAVLDASPMLERFDDWPGGKHGSRHPVAFWRSR